MKYHMISKLRTPKISQTVSNYLEICISSVILTMILIAALLCCIAHGQVLIGLILTLLFEYYFEFL